jgi:hypothetical protein
MRWLPLLLLNGCAMSLEGFGRLRTQVSDENEARRLAAEKSLLAEHHATPTAAKGLEAFLPMPIVRRCQLLVAGYRLVAGEARPSPDEPAALELHDGTSVVRVDDVTLGPVCDFFQHRRQALEVHTGQQTRVLEPWPGPTAMNAAGQVLRYRTVPMTTRTLRPLVKTFCNRMPQVQPAPFELGQPQLAVWWVPEPRPPLIEATWEQTAIEETCTDTAW